MVSRSFVSGDRVIAAGRTNQNTIVSTLLTTVIILHNLPSTAAAALLARPKVESSSGHNGHKTWRKYF